MHTQDLTEYTQGLYPSPITAVLYYALIQIRNDDMFALPWLFFFRACDIIRIVTLYMMFVYFFISLANSHQTNFPSNSFFFFFFKGTGTPQILPFSPTRLFPD